MQQPYFYFSLSPIIGDHSSVQIYALAFLSPALLCDMRCYLFD